MSSALRQLWLSAPPGRMSPWQQARALALREVSRELHAGRTQLEWVAARVEKVGAQLVCTLNRPEPPPEPRFFGKA